jgi:hypothetical protein
MPHQDSLTPATDPLSQLSARMEAWRNDPKKSRRIPQELWQAAVELSKEYSINQISKALRLSYTDLKKRVGRSRYAADKKHLPPNVVL